MFKKRLLTRLKPILSGISLMLLALLFVLISSIRINLAIARAQFPEPQAILTLGGGNQREVFAAQFAKHHPTLPIWVSSGVPDDAAQAIFQTAGVEPDRLYLDRRALDTVTNFTTLVRDFKTQGIRHVYLITSDYHMQRARAIAFVVFGSQGILTTPVPIPSDTPPETLLRVSRDVGRSILWVTTGRTGASLNPRFQSRTEVSQK